MIGNKKIWMMAAGAFVGGVTAGIVIAPQSGRDLRKGVAVRATQQLGWMEERLRGIEEQLRELEHQLAASGSQIGDRLRERTVRAVDQVLPTLPDAADAWRLGHDEVTRELRNLPRA